MRKYYLLAGAAVAGLVLGSAGASASPIAAPSGPLWSHVEGVEQFIPLNGDGFAATSGNTGGDCLGCGVLPGSTEGNWGVGIVDKLDLGNITQPGVKITDSGSTEFISTPGGSEITFMFYGLTNTAVGTPTQSNGGVIAIYWWDKNSVTQTSLQASNPATARNAQNQYTNVTCGGIGNTGTGCTLLAVLDLVPGAAALGPGVINPTVTESGTADPSSNSTLGSALLYAEVDKSIVGAWTNALAGQFFTASTITGNPTLPDTADFRLSSVYTACSNGSTDCPNWGNNRSTFGLSFTDPATGASVPEPSSLGLLGAALVGLGGMVAWRRRRRTDAAA